MCKGCGSIKQEVKIYFKAFAFFLLLVFLSAYSLHLQAADLPQLSDFPQDFPNELDYVSFLQRFPKYAKTLWHDTYRGDPQMGYFGTGHHDHNQMRALSNFIFTYALLSSEELYSKAFSGVDQATLLNNARMALRYMTATHVTGDLLCVDNEKWGKQPEQWLSPWVISKMVAGAHLIWDKLTTEERQDIKRVVIHEANYQLGVEADSREYEDTHAEFNALNSEVLAWAYSLYPEHTNSARWLSKAQEFFMNTFSVRDDRSNTTIVEGKPVNQWVYTVNVHPDFTIEGHGVNQNP